MKALAKTLQSTALFVLMALWLLAYVTAHLWPTSSWMDVSRVSAGPARAVEPVPMNVAREIHRPFLGVWVVTVRKWSDSQGWVTYCAATGASQYREGAELPAKLTLDWWTGRSCPALTAGRYVVSTTWTITPAFSILPEKQLSVDSNIFEVLP
jgi:hypothetical protein